MGKKNSVKADAQVMHDVLEIVKKEVSVVSPQKKSFNSVVSSLQKLALRKKMPHLKNVFSFVFSGNAVSMKHSKKDVVRNCNLAQVLLRQNGELLQDNIAGKIKNNARVFVHCLNEKIVHALLRAAQDGNKCTLLMVQSPFAPSAEVFVKKLIKQGVFVEWFPVSAARQALKNADVVVLGAEAVTSDKVVTEMGGELFSELAVQRGIPVFAVASSFQFHNSIDVRVLRNSNSAVCFRHVFEKVNPSLITGIISEKGVHEPSVFVSIMQKKQSIFC